MNSSLLAWALPWALALAAEVQTLPSLLAFAQGVRLEIRAVLKSKTSGLAQNHCEIEQNQQRQIL